MKKSYTDLLDELAQWEVHELMQQHSVSELRELREKFEKHRTELISAIEQKETSGDL